MKKEIESNCNLFVLAYSGVMNIVDEKRVLVYTRRHQDVGYDICLLNGPVELDRPQRAN